MPVYKVLTVRKQLGVCFVFFYGALHLYTVFWVSKLAKVNLLEENVSRNVPLSCAFWAIHWFLFDSMTSFSRRMWSSKFRKKVNILALTSSCDTLVVGGIHCVVVSVIWQRWAINNALAKGSKKFSNQDASKRDLGDIETWPVEPLISRARDTAGVGLAVSKQASFNSTSRWYLRQALVILHFHDSKETYPIINI